MPAWGGGAPARHPRRALHGRCQSHLLLVPMVCRLKCLGGGAHSPPTCSLLQLSGGSSSWLKVDVDHQIHVEQGRASHAKFLRCGVCRCSLQDQGKSATVKGGEILPLVEKLCQGVAKPTPELASLRFLGGGSRWVGSSGSGAADGQARAGPGATDGWAQPGPAHLQATWPPAWPPLLHVLLSSNRLSCSPSRGGLGDSKGKGGGGA